MQTVYFPNLPDASSPEYIRLDGLDAAGDGGPARLRRQDTPIPFEGIQLITNPSFATNPGGGSDWSLNGWTWSAGKLGPNPGVVKTATQPMASGWASLQPYRVRVTFEGAGEGNWQVKILNQRGTLSRVIATGTTGNCDVVFTSREQDLSIQIAGDAEFNGAVLDVSMKLENDQGQLELMGAQYAPEPLNGVLRPEMFRRAGDANDDAAISRLVRRVNVLLERNDIASIRVEVPGRYVCVRDEHVVSVPEGKDITIDGLGSGYFDLSGVSTTVTRPWLQLSGPGYKGIKTTLSSATAADDKTLPVLSISGFGRGDYIAITSTWDYFNGIGDLSGYSRCNKGELIQILGVKSSSLTTKSGTTHAYPQHVDPSANPVNVRRIGMAGTCTIRGLRAGGQGHADIDEDRGVSFLRIRCFEVVSAEHCTNKNFMGDSVQIQMCGRLAIDTPRTTGWDLADPTNDGAASQWFYGWMVQGCISGSITSPIGEYCRRAIDLSEATLATLASDAIAGEAVITQNVTMTGGYSDSCQTQPGGHQSINTQLINHICSGRMGGQIRGKNVTWIGVSLDGGVGIGFSKVMDETTPYTENPSCGEVTFIGCTIRSPSLDNVGIGVWVSIDRLTVKDCVLAGAEPIVLYGKNQSNVTIDGCDILCTVSANAVIASKNRLVGGVQFTKDCSNWLICNNRLANGSYAVSLDGTTEAVGARNIRILDNSFEDIRTAHIRFGSAGVWDVAGDTEVVGNLERKVAVGAFPATKIQAANSVLVSVYDNNFDDRPFTVTPVDGVLTVPAASRSAVIRLQANISSPTTVSQIRGVPNGKIVVVSLVSGGATLTLSAVPTGSNLRMPGDQELDTTLDRVAFQISGNNAVMLSAANNI